MLTKPLLAALLLFPACGPTPAERAQAVALQRLPRLLGEGFRPASVRVYRFPAFEASKYLRGKQPAQEAELVTYTYFVPTNNPLASTLGQDVKFAALVDRQDSLTFFVPDQHQQEFAWNYGVYYHPH